MEPLPGPTSIPRAKKGLFNQALGRSRGGISTKIHLISDARGNPMNVVRASLTTRYDKTARTYAAQVAIACFVLWLKPEHHPRSVESPGKKSKRWGAENSLGRWGKAGEPRWFVCFRQACVNP